MKTIITHPNFDYLGEQIVAANPGKIIKANVDFNYFRDGTPNFFIQRVNDLIEHKDVIYLGDFSEMIDVYPNYVIMRGIITNKANVLKVIMPYFPGTMDRVDEDGEIATAKYYADLYSNVPSGKKGKTSIDIFDIHALQEVSYFDEFKVHMENHTAMYLLKDYIKGKTIGFPDDGAKKRFGKYFKDFETVLFSKIRIDGKRILTFKEGEVKGREIVLVDDLIQTGGTLIEASKILNFMGAKSVSAFATHGVFPDGTEKELAKYVDKLIVTDSIPKNIKLAEEIENMEVFSLKSDIEKLIFNG